MAEHRKIEKEMAAQHVAEEKRMAEQRKEENEKQIDEMKKKFRGAEQKKIENTPLNETPGIECVYVFM
jgi:hypothetical protein